MTDRQAAIVNRACPTSSQRRRCHDGALYRHCVSDLLRSQCSRACSRRRGAAQDKVKVGVFPVSSSLPYFVALEHGFFKEQNIETEMARLIGGPPNVAAMIEQPDRRRGGTGDDRRHERQHQEARRGHVHLDQQPEQEISDGAVRRAQGPRSEDARRPQGREDHVGARARQRHHGKGGARRRRAQGRRLQHRPARHGPARQRDDSRHLRRRLYARAQCLHHAQARRRDHPRSRRDRPLCSGRSQTPTPSSAAARLPRISSRAAGRGEALYRGLGKARRSDQRATPPRRASISSRTPSPRRTWSIPCRWSAISWPRT